MPFTRTYLLYLASLLFLLVFLAGCSEPLLAPSSTVNLERDSDEHSHPTALADGEMLSIPKGHRAGILIQSRMGAPFSLNILNAVDDVHIERVWAETQHGVTYAVFRIDNRTHPVVNIRFNGSAEVALAEVLRTPLPHASVDPAPPTPSDAVGSSREALRSDLMALGVMPREEWNASPATCSTPETRKNKITIHHTAGSGVGDARMTIKQIQTYHMTVNGWCDVGYHFLVSPDGTIWEGRLLDTVGAHVEGNNTDNIGISFMGCFDGKMGCYAFEPKVPSMVSLEKAKLMINLLANLFEIPFDEDHLKGHRDFSTANTACPGDALYGHLDFFRMNFSRDAGMGSDANTSIDASAGIDAMAFDTKPGTLALCRCGLHGTPKRFSSHLSIGFLFILACFFRRSYSGFKDAIRSCSSSLSRLF